MSNDTKVMQDQDTAILDKWATEPDGPVALYLKQTLLPVEDSRIIFPPTYADIGYNIDTLSDGKRVATIDSVGSQANRLEPIFKSDPTNPDEWLVPQIEIDLGDKTIALLDLAHRAADAVVRSSPELFLKLIEPAFTELQKKGNAGRLCAIAPTSLVFGVWDSRGDSGVKCPRLVRSIIRAWDVEVIHAAAQFNSSWKLLKGDDQKELEEEEKKKDRKGLSEVGLKDAPVTFRKTDKIRQFVDGAPNPEARVLGGVLVKENGRIEREVTVNLVALRNLRGENDTETDALRKYLLGLSLVAATADMELFLREGCLLRYAENSDTWWQVPRRGEPTQVNLSRDTIKHYAKTVTGHFRDEWPKVFKDKWPKNGTMPELKYQFDIEEAKKLLAKKTKGERAADLEQSS
ncbi:type I-U CRISPR-associated RAMP protein Csb1/Cas7u [Chloracidobacterium thermophilum]|uniref:type I-G CRISPR-associated RAMP protein Csb1/Cas7g n=1 Tax=Chloracidobacterium thermophilum TaxID=458033 RepID=UPI000738C90E|nr:type I-U CRISPR-associated RAMP protein Csb1/Cas7u [Chloracidobacterium thermophilum]